MNTSSHQLHSQTANRDKIAAQHARGKLTARERIELLVDPSSFLEIDRYVKPNHESRIKSGMIETADQPSRYTDGVVTGLASINGRRIALFAQDFTIQGGSVGKLHAAKICKIMDHAARIGCPIIGLIDSGGARIGEGIHALAGYGDIFKRNVRYSGIIPQISVVLGPCAGGAVYSPALTDLIFTVRGTSQLFITGPQVIAQVTGEKIDKESLGGAQVHSTQSGVVHAVYDDEQACLDSVREALGYLPDNYKDAPQEMNPSFQSSRFAASADTAKTNTICCHQKHFAQEAKSESIPAKATIRREGRVIPDSDPGSLVPSDHSRAYDMRDVIAATVDADTFFELSSAFAANIITGFARLNGISIGVVANQPLVKAGSIDINASCKAARFINLCNAFDLPVVSLVDVPGYLPGVGQEHGGIIRHGAKLLHAYAQATVPLLTVIVRKAFGGAYIVMGSRHLGADWVAAWPEAQIAVLGAPTAVQIMHGKKLKEMDTGSKSGMTNPRSISNARKRLEEEYTQEFLNPDVAAAYGYIDAIIEPHTTRAQLVAALMMLQSKVEKMPEKKAGNGPL